MKVCKKCNIEREDNQYFLDKRKNKYGITCKICHSMQKAEHRKTEGYKELKKASNRRFIESDKEAYKEKYLQYYQDKYKEHVKEYYQENREKIIKKNVAYLTQKLKDDPRFKIIHNLRSNLRQVLKQKMIRKNKNTFTLLEYTKKDFLDRFEEDIKKYDESGIKYHIDHKIPVSWFNDKTPMDIIFNLENLQLIDGTENSEKNNRFMHQVGQEYLEKAIIFILPEFLDRIKPNL